MRTPATLDERVAYALAHPTRTDAMRFVLRDHEAIHAVDASAFDALYSTDHGHDWPSRIPGLVGICGRS